MMKILFSSINKIDVNFYLHLYFNKFLIDFYSLKVQKEVSNFIIKVKFKCMHESLNDEKVAKIQNYDAEALVCLLNFK